MRPSTWYIVAALAATILLTVIFARWLTTDIFVAWVFATNVAAFLAFGYDKAIAGTRTPRVPERVLLLLALLGGTPGAWAGMEVFRHKTAKMSFRGSFWLVVLLQFILLLAYLAFRR
jgi:uncharacterized membrane protein YsdA (DUF1294 family)